MPRNLTRPAALLAVLAVLMLAALMLAGCAAVPDVVSPAVATSPATTAADRAVAQKAHAHQHASSPVCDAGTYVNSSGHTVCRPSKTEANGASAVCRDGSSSFSEHRRGTCSHHGGVDRWLKNLP